MAAVLVVLAVLAFLAYAVWALCRAAGNEVDGEQLHGFDPVYWNPSDGKWYFWDEAGYTSYGPYDSEEIARSQIASYAASME